MSLRERPLLNPSDGVPLVTGMIMKPSNTVSDIILLYEEKYVIIEGALRFMSPRNRPEQIKL